MGPKVESSASGSSPGVKYHPSTPNPIHASPVGSEGSRTGPPPPWGLLGSETQQLKKQPQSSPGRHSSGLRSHREDAGSGRQSGQCLDRVRQGLLDSAPPGWSGSVEEKSFHQAQG